MYSMFIVQQTISLKKKRKHGMCDIRRELKLYCQGVTKRDVVYLGWPIAPSYVSPNAGGGGGVLRGLSQWVQLYTGAQRNLIWRSNSIWFSVLALFKSVTVSGGTQHSLSVVRKNPTVLHILAHVASILWKTVYIWAAPGDTGTCVWMRCEDFHAHEQYIGLD